MTYEEFLHAVRSAAEVASIDELLVFGSQAVLLTHPDAPAELRQSVELDAVAIRHPERWELIDGQLGELSLFHQTHGFYVHGVNIEYDFVDTQKLIRRVARLAVPTELRGRLREWIGAVAHRLSGP